MILPPPRKTAASDDIERMCALLQAGRAAGTPSYYVHVGDLKWWLNYPYLGSAGWEHIYAWDDPAHPGRLLGWALLAPEGKTFDVFYQPELSGTALAAGMLAWAEGLALELARAAGAAKVSMFWVAPADAWRVGWLEARGYRVEMEDTALARPLQGEIPLGHEPDGFTVRSCSGLDEVEERARAVYGAFGSSADFERYVERFRRFMQSPVYSPDMDVVAAAPDGRIAAFCITWADDLNRVGLFEPVGTYPDFQRKGLGRAVMLEGLRRLQARGMQRAILCTEAGNAPALGLYTGLGFEPVTPLRLYVKEV